MNRDLATALVVSGALHFGTLMVFAVQMRTPAAVVEQAEETVVWLDADFAEEQDVEQVPEDELPKPSAEEAQAYEAPPASLPEPPRAFEMEAISDRVVVRPPNPPRPDALSGFSTVPRGSGSRGGAAGPSMPDVFSIDQLDRAPQIRFRPSPVYPFDLRRSGITGSAEIWMRVNEDGAVIDARVLNATHTDFGRAALDAVRRFRFTPGTRAGRPVQFSLIQPIPFTLTTDTDR